MTPPRVLLCSLHGVERPSWCYECDAIVLQEIGPGFYHYRECMGAPTDPPADRDTVRVNRFGDDDPSLAWASDTQH